MERHESINLPQSIPLWPAGRMPLASEADEDFPTFTYYLPSEEYRTGQSVLILPGGGYHLVSTAKEGHRPAQYLAAQGIAAGVLEYRHHPSRFPVPLLDAQRAIRLMRSLADTHELDSEQVGCLGFSAGGHLAGLLATQSPHPLVDVGDEVDAFSPGLDFCALVYGVVTLVGPHANEGSSRGLLGDPPPKNEAEGLSIERSIQTDSPRFFIAHGQGDTTVPVENALYLYNACLEKNVSAVMHLYDDLPHGVGMEAMHRWISDLMSWLSSIGRK